MQGLTVRSTTVEGCPPEINPESSIKAVSLPNSASMSKGLFMDGRPLRFTLVEYSGNPKSLIRFRRDVSFGILKAAVPPSISGKTKVKGPGQRFRISVSRGITATASKAEISAISRRKGLCSSRPFIARIRSSVSGTLPVNPYIVSQAITTTSPDFRDSVSFRRLSLLRFNSIS